MSPATLKWSQFGALDAEHHHRPVSLGDHVGEFHQVLGAALCDAVGEFRRGGEGAGLAAEMDVLDLDIGRLGIVGAAPPAAGRPGSTCRTFTSRRIDA